MALVRIGNVSDLPEGAMMPARVNGRDFVVCRSNGELRAFDGLCPHQNGPLAQGNFTEGRIICPWHAWEFDARSGCLDFNPTVSLTQYPVVLDGDSIFLDA